LQKRTRLISSHTNPITSIKGDKKKDECPMSKELSYTVKSLKIELIEPSPAAAGIYKQTYANINSHRIVGARIIDRTYIKELSKSIKNQGLLHPIYVRKIEGNKYQVISGNCRYYACLQNSITDIEVREVKADDIESKAMLIRLNLHQRPLNEIEEGWVLKELLESDKLSYRKLEKLIGKDKNWIYRRLKLVNSLAEQVQLDVIMKLITPRIAAEISVVPMWGQIDLSNIIKGHRINYEELRELIKIYRSGEIEDELRESILSDPIGTARKLKRCEVINKEPGVPLLLTNIKNKLKLISSIIKDLCVNFQINKLDQRCRKNELEQIIPYIDDTVKNAKRLYTELVKLNERIK